MVNQIKPKGRKMLRKLKGIYYLWAVFHMFLLLLSPSGKKAITESYPFNYYNHMFDVNIFSKFFPFNVDHFKYYDITEFLFYLIVPVLLYFAIKEFRVIEWLMEEKWEGCSIEGCNNKVSLNIDGEYCAVHNSEPNDNECSKCRNAYDKSFHPKCPNCGEVNPIVSS